MVPAEPIVLPFTFKTNSQLEHLIIRSNLLGPREFELSGLALYLDLYKFYLCTLYLFWMMIALWSTLCCWFIPLNLSYLYLVVGFMCLQMKIREYNESRPSRTAAHKDHGPRVVSQRDSSKDINKLSSKPQKSLTGEENVCSLF